MAIALKFKQLKPATLKQKEMRLELLNELRKVGKGIKTDFQATTKTWEHKPEFEMLISLAGVGPAVLVGTDDEIYNYVNDGTKRHIIRPKRARFLRFQGTYKAKTSPGVIGSGSGGSSGDVVYSRGVVHPGTKARHFDKAITKKWKKPYLDHMHAAMKRARAKSGHAI